MWLRNIKNILFSYPRPIVLLALLCTSLTGHAENSIEFEWDPYYSNAGYYISLTDEPIPEQPKDLLWKAVLLCYQRSSYRKYLAIAFNELGIYYRRLEKYDICTGLYHQSLEHLAPGEYRRTSLIHFNLFQQQNNELELHHPLLF